MNKLNKYQTLIILFAILLGLLLGKNDFIARKAGEAILPFLAVMLFASFLEISLKEVKSSFRNLKFTATSLVINFILTPLLAYLLGSIFLPQQQALWIGFVMLMVTPCTDWYLVFTGIAKGNIALSTSILPINLILQIILLPVYLWMFFGRSGSIDIPLLAKSILWVLILPLVLAFVLKMLNKHKIRKEEGIKIEKNFGQTQLLFLALAIMAMFASEGQALTSNLQIIYLLLIPILIFFILIFVLGRIISRFLKFSYEDSVSLCMTTLARNSPIALALAITAFPSEALIALSLVIGSLIELPVLALTTQVMLNIKKRKPIIV